MCFSLSLLVEPSPTDTCFSLSLLVEPSLTDTEEPRLVIFVRGFCCLTCMLPFRWS